MQHQGRNATPAASKVLHLMVMKFLRDLLIFKPSMPRCPECRK
jgi:hypothetical protein